MTCMWPLATICRKACRMHYFLPRRCPESNKIMYHDKAKALAAADQSLIERDVELWVYRCQFCGYWHLTHRNPDSPVADGVGRMSRRPHSRKRGFKPRRR